jgi:hypothetical protein
MSVDNSGLEQNNEIKNINGSRAIHIVPIQLE